MKVFFSCIVDKKWHFIKLQSKMFQIYLQYLVYKAMSTSLNLRMDILKKNGQLLDGNHRNLEIYLCFKYTHTHVSNCMWFFYLWKFEDELVTVEKLIILHPLFISLWMRLADVIDLKLNATTTTASSLLTPPPPLVCAAAASTANAIKLTTVTNDNDNNSERNALINHYSVCYSTISELIRHGYQFRSEIVSKQKQKQKLWV